MKTNVSPVHDGINSDYIRPVSHTIIKPLTRIINVPLMAGCFPNQLKVAKNGEVKDIYINNSCHTTIMNQDVFKNKAGNF